MAKFRERFLILLLSLSTLALIAVLRVCQVTSEDSSTSNIPGIETFNNLKRSSLNYEIIDFDLFDQLTTTQRFKEAVSNDNDVVEVSKNNNVVEVSRNNNVLEASRNNNVVEASRNNNVVEVSRNNNVVEASRNNNVVEASRNDDFLQTETKSPEHNSNNVVSHLSRPPNMTLILAESRSGSTWLLDALSQPTNSMTFFEPLNAIPHSRFLASVLNDRTPQVMIKFRQNKLSQICSCNLTTQIMGGISGWQRNYLDRTGIRMNHVMDHCLNNYLTRIVKTIRLYNISELSGLPGLGCSNFKVIHLIRDPRAVMLSRIETFHELYDGNHKLGARLSGTQRDYDEDYMRRAARDYCSNHLYNFEVGSRPPLWLHKRYIMIKYEDLALHPIESIKSLFSFINQNFTAEIASYVYKGSHSKIGRGGYGVRKNSSSVARAWKGRLIWQHVRVIQEECQAFLQLFDYEILNENN